MKTLYTTYNNFAKRLVMSLMVLMTIGVGSVLGAEELAYTIVFSNGASGNSEIKTTTQASTVIASDSRKYVTTSPFSAISKAYYGDTKTSIRLGTSSAAGALTIALSSDGKVSATKIVVSCGYWKSGENPTLSINSLASQSISSSGQDLTFSVNKDISSLTLNTSKRAYIYSISVYTEASATTYAVTWKNGGHGTAPTSPTSASEVKLPTLSATGYTHTGWIADVAVKDGSTTIEAGDLINNGTTVTLSQATTFTAQWTANKYTVNFIASPNGYGSVTQSKIDNVPYGTVVTSNSNTITISGTTVTANPAEKDANYSYLFNNWTGIPSGNNVTANCTITANFTRTERKLTNYRTSCSTNYSVTYDPNGATSGSVPEDNNEYTANSSVTVLGNTGDLAKTGYTFIGWNTQADGNGNAYQSGNAFNITENTTLYAQWKANTYTVKFYGNGSDGGSMNDQSFTYGQSQNLTANAYVRTGYTFDGWNTKPDGQGTSYSDKQQVQNLTTENNATITLYAQWKIQTFTVTFNSNGGAGTMTSQTFTYNVAQALTANSFTRTGYTFTGWNTKADGSGDSYTDKQSITLTTAGLTLYAQWKANTYTVKFDGNGSDSGSMNDQSFTYGQSQSLTANAFTRANYTFKNWNTKADGSGTAYTDKQSVSNLTTTNGETVTIYAQWTPVYTITWMVSGQVYHTQSAVEGTILEIPSAPNAATYPCNDKVFVGWTENQIAGNTNTKPTDLFTSKSSTLTTNATYYAVFADVEGVASTDYEKITAVSDLTDGKYVIAYGYNTTTPSIILKATPRDETTLVATSSSPSSNKYQNPAAENIWTIKKNGTTYTLYNETTSKYVQANTTPALLLSEANPTNFVIESLDTYWKIKISDYTSYQLVGYTNSSGNYFQTKSGVSANYKIQLYKNTSTQRFFNYSTNCIMTYVISFDLKGHGLDQKPEEQIVEENGTVTEPSPAPKAEGYDFGGWFTDSECTSPYDFSSPVTASFTLYAKWTAIEYTITYDNLNGGNNDANPKTYTIESETITLKNLDDTNTHHFVGWYDEDDNLVTKIPQGSTGDITLYAKWVEIFTVKWYANGKELTNGELGSASTIVYEGEHISNLPPSVNLNNYCGDFVGWTDAEMDVNNVAKPNNLYTQASEFPNATGNQEFFAVFAE